MAVRNSRPFVPIGFRAGAAFNRSPSFSRVSGLAGCDENLGLSSERQVLRLRSQ